MSAVLVPYVPPGYDDGRPRLMVECLECGIEWGWTLESSEYAKYLPSMAVEHNARYHAREANVAKTMAEVLAWHDDWTYLILRNAMVCKGCGWSKPLSEDESSRDAFRTHQSAALSAAGYGLVADFRESNLKAITEEIANPLRGRDVES